ncbi:unnamed protein product [Litomosoides sigmodontis]|uniref:Uncharacterized protein n=1 Tax=Litomosoides sigmodontis TaxID=42156 RepID=A0A3P6TKR5_LITSI|nr:unnamed protein product [Litomosoides sigmodontis]
MEAEDQYGRKIGKLPQHSQRSPFFTTTGADLPLFGLCTWLHRPEDLPDNYKLPLENGHVVPELIEHIETWKVMENLYKAEILKAIGYPTSMKNKYNIFSITQLRNHIIYRCGSLANNDYTTRPLTFFFGSGFNVFQILRHTEKFFVIIRFGFEI